ncbi:unnamed protein product [Sphagnum troendelagicum]|jgi:hypothetical protein|uniref:Uncharacterized protein n=1 Tax=Sphagnum jensenii TaxID=128206 RepID=A0ABP0X2J5_9BRYO
MPEPEAMEESLQVDQTVSLISGHEPDLEAGGDILTDAIQCQQMVGCSSEEDGGEEEDGVEEQARGAEEEESVKLEHISLEESNEEEEEAEPDEDEQVAKSPAHGLRRHPKTTMKLAPKVPKAHTPSLAIVLHVSIRSVVEVLQ